MLEDLNKRNMQLMSMNEKYKINFTTSEKSLAKYQDIEKEMAVLKRELKDRDERLTEQNAREKAYKHLEDCYTKVRKEKDERAQKKAEKLAKKTLDFNEKEVKMDALGNTIKEAEPEKKEVNRADRKKLMKQRKDMIKNGEDTYEIDQLLGIE